MAADKKNEAHLPSEGKSSATAPAVDRMAAARAGRNKRSGYGLDRDLTAIEKSAIAKLRSIRSDAKLAIDAINRGEVDAGQNLAAIADALASVARIV